MGLYLRQDENRSKLQEKLDAELREKAKQQQAKMADANTPDGVEDSSFVKNSQKTKGMYWMIILAVALGIFLTVILLS